VALKERTSIVLVTNNTKQAARASDRTAFFLLGDLVEVGPDRAALHQTDPEENQRLPGGHFG